MKEITQGYLLNVPIRQCEGCDCLFVAESGNSRCGKCLPSMPTKEPEMPRGMGPNGMYLFQGNEYPFMLWEQMVEEHIEDLKKRKCLPQAQYWAELLEEVRLHERRKHEAPPKYTGHVDANGNIVVEGVEK